MRSFLLGRINLVRGDILGWTRTPALLLRLHSRLDPPSLKPPLPQCHQVLALQLLGGWPIVSNPRPGISEVIPHKARRGLSPTHPDGRPRFKSPPPSYCYLEYSLSASMLSLAVLSTPYLFPVVASATPSNHLAKDSMQCNLVFFISPLDPKTASHLSGCILACGIQIRRCLNARTGGLES
ncbi:hypothetical protein BJX61DRAFT_180484 [Aspergillus egyptiacus]|nr:hypothetical protein BJX61DRAFT_180484 [Aspergillus egyptiacus]